MKLKNFRDKWVGSTESNLEKIFRLLQALGRCFVFVDEADQALGKRDAGVRRLRRRRGRVYEMMAEEMSDTRNRGKIVWILASSRPDLIEVDLKRPGRIDVKIPLFPTTSDEEGFALIRALCRRYGLDVPETALPALRDSLPELLTPAAAEAIAFKVYRVVRTQQIEPEAALAQQLQTYRSPVPREVMEVPDRPGGAGGLGPGAGARGLPVLLTGRVDRSTAVGPDLLPPGLVDVFGRHLGTRLEVHAAADLVDVPAGQGGKRLRLPAPALGQRPAVVAGLCALRLALPRVAQDVAALEVLAVAGLLEDQVLGEVLAVVAHVEAGEEDVLAPPPGGMAGGTPGLATPAACPARRRRARAAPRATADRRRRGRTSSCPRRTRGTPRACPRFSTCCGEHRLVEVAELVLDVQRHVDVRWAA